MTVRPLIATTAFALLTLHATTLADAGRATVAPPAVFAEGDGASLVVAYAEAAAAQAVADSFVRFVRYPAEEETLLGITSTPPAAFYRDLLSGGETLHAGGSDGDIVSAQITPPNGTPLSFQGFRYDGARRCWVRQSAPADCIGSAGASTIRVAWLHGTQCGASGDWQMRFTRNGQEVATSSYHLTPAINPDKVSFIQAPAYNQGHYSTVQYGNICRDPADGEFKTCSLVTTPNPPQARISQLGCLLTGYAAALSYHGLATLPNELNDYLQDYNGYNDGGAIIPQVVVRYARSRNPDLKLTPVRRNAAGESGTVLAGIARDAVCRSGPTPLSVRHHSVANPTGAPRGHFATAWGRPEPETTYLLKDPNGGRSNRLDSTEVPRDYRNLHYGTRELREAPPTFVFADSLTISLHSPAELLLTDPSGRRTGIDPAANATHNEIPGSSYGVDAIDPPDEPDIKGIESKMLEITPVDAGNYSLRVTGTGSGKYSLDFLFLSADDVGSAKTAVRDVPTAVGTVHTYLFTAPFTPGESIKLGGGFDGGGQRPRDVNKFLSYATLAQSRTVVPAGTTSYPLLIAYDAAIAPASFTATLNGATITTAFHPVPGGFETVMIQLARGNNTLVLSIDGRAGTRTATDTDRLVFQVP